MILYKPIRNAFPINHNIKIPQIFQFATSTHHRVSLNPKCDLKVPNFNYKFSIFTFRRTLFHHSRAQKKKNYNNLVIRDPTVKTYKLHLFLSTEPGLI